MAICSQLCVDIPAARRPTRSSERSITTIGMYLLFSVGQKMLTMIYSTCPVKSSLQHLASIPDARWYAGMA